MGAQEAFVPGQQPFHLEVLVRRQRGIWHARPIIQKELDSRYFSAKREFKMT
jgi:hypothetical protein